MKTTINGSVQRLLKPSKCEHLVNWPSIEHIRAGFIECPFCIIEALRIQIAEHLRVHTLLADNYAKVLEERQTASALAQASNMKAVALQHFAINLCDTAQKTAELKLVLEHFQESSGRDHLHGSESAGCCDRSA